MFAIMSVVESWQKVLLCQKKKKWSGTKLWATFV